MPLGSPALSAWCQTPLQGRSDKKFCSPNCRSQVQRHGVPDGPIDWPAHLAAAEKRAQALQHQLDQHAQAQQAARPFDERYDQLLGLVGLLARAIEDEQALANHLGFVDEQLGKYQQHPGLVTGQAPARQRLLILQQVRADLADQVQHVATLRHLKQSWQQPAAHQVAAPGPAVTARTGPELLVSSVKDATLG
jgi:hypothetical protein